MPALLLSLLPLLGRVAPELLGFAFAGSGAGGGEVAARIEAAVRDVFGTADAAEVQAAAAADPSKVDALKVRLDAETDQIRASLADVAGARAATAALVAARSPLAWGSPVISTVVVCAFAAVAVVVFARYGVDSAVGQLIAGALIAKFGTVVDFWLGSSRGSAERSDAVLSMLHQAIGTAASGAAGSGVVPGAVFGAFPASARRGRP